MEHSDLLMFPDNLSRKSSHTSNSVLPFEQIKGRLVADYQVQLESEWISQLRSKADIKINKKELKRIYKTIEN